MNKYSKKTLRESLNTKIFYRCLMVLSKKDKRKIVYIVVAQVVFGFLDLAGVALIGVLSALSVSGIQSVAPENRVSLVLDFFNISNFSLQSQVAILGTIAMSLLVSRTILSVIFTRKILYFMSIRGASLASNLAYKWLLQPLTMIQTKTTQETVYSLGIGVQLITVGIIATIANLITDGALLFIIFVGLFAVDAITALTSLLLFGIVSLVIYRSTSARSITLGSEKATLSVASDAKMIEVLMSYRESVVRNRRGYYALEIEKIRTKLANVDAEIQFLPNISKYLVESTVIVGAVLISGLQFFLKDASQAIATLAIFMAAGTRLAPAVMRMQQGLIGIKTSTGGARATLELIEILGTEREIIEAPVELNIDHKDFEPSIRIVGLNWTYPQSNKKALSNIDLEINSGESIALVGASGAGKTTLVDALLGVLPVTGDCVKISGLSPANAIKMWAGAIAYVPQDVLIADGTVRENIALGYSTSEISDELIWDALEIAQLRFFVESLPNGLDSHVGERGLRISGGQRQRLGIARAMLSRPKLLVLDEATSSLDGQTESDISSAIQGLRGVVTVVMIAHRLSMVRMADRVIYMADGEIKATGLFEVVRKQVPNFDQQAKLMGL